MIQRCYDANSTAYPYYGATGVMVCERWRTSFQNFLDDMGERSEGKTIDRFPNAAGNYEPGNCRWATAREQSNNRRNNRLLSFGSQTKTMSEWARVIGIHPQTFKSRIDKGWPIDRAINTPLRSGARL
jgi:hypothetical protein